MGIARGREAGSEEQEAGSERRKEGSVRIDPRFHNRSE